MEIVLGCNSPNESLLLLLGIIYLGSIVYYDQIVALEAQTVDCKNDPYHRPARVDFDFH